jgi:hypothetical protein
MDYTTTRDVNVVVSPILGTLRKQTILYGFVALANNSSTVISIDVQFSCLPNLIYIVQI